jgi:uncharacterized membrane protein
MAEHYVLLKWLHVVGATVIFGTGLGTAFHFWITQRRENAAAIAAAARSTVLADYFLTLPAVILQPATGFALAIAAGYPLASTWIVAGIALYVLAAACWIPVVFIQIRLRDIAQRAARDGTALGPEFARLVRLWTMLGWPAFIAMAATFWLMIARPA